MTVVFLEKGEAHTWRDETVLADLDRCGRQVALVVYFRSLEEDFDVVLVCFPGAASASGARIPHNFLHN